MKKIIIFTVGFFVTLLAAGALPAFAQTCPASGPLRAGCLKLQTSVGPTGLQPDLTVSVGTVIRGILSAVGTIFLILTVYAGILWMTAQGAAEQIEKAQNIVSAAIIGLFITMAAYAITSFVTGRLGNVASGGNTNNASAPVILGPPVSNKCGDNDTLGKPTWCVTQNADYAVMEQACTQGLVFGSLDCPRPQVCCETP